MPNKTSPSVEEFQRSLEALVQQAQQTAQLGFNVAKEQVETLVKTPPDLATQMEELRRNVQNMARDIETKAQEIVAVASNYIPQPGANPFTPPPARPATPVTEVKVEPPAAHESATAAGAGTEQTGSQMDEPTPTPNGEAPRQ